MERDFFVMGQRKMEKRIPGFLDYTVDELGNVYSYKCQRKMKLKPWVNKSGYHEVRFRNGSAPCKVFKVHRLVAKAFVPGFSEVRDEVNHIDLDKANNRASNLEWVDRCENMSHLHRVNRERGTTMARGEARKSSKKIIATCLATGETRHYHSAVVAEKDGFDCHCIYLAVAGKIKAHKGFSFQRA